MFIFHQSLHLDRKWKPGTKKSNGRVTCRTGGDLFLQQQLACVPVYCILVTRSWPLGPYIGLPKAHVRFKDDSVFIYENVLQLNSASMLYQYFCYSINSTLHIVSSHGLKHSSLQIGDDCTYWQWFDDGHSNG